MINKYDMHKIIDDLKRIARIVPILRDENNQKQRERLGQLALDELQKLTDDLEEIKSQNGDKEVPFPLMVIQNEWCVVFCPLCQSSFPRRHVFFGKRYCINPKCKNSLNRGV